MSSMRVARLILVTSLAAVAVAAQAAADKIVKIRPILTAKSDGTDVQIDVSYPTYLNKIWAQAGIEFQFESPVQLNDDNYHTFNGSDANPSIPYNLVRAPGKGQSSDPLVINCFFVNEVINTSVYGFAYFDEPYAVMDVSAITGFSALGRVDTFAHEIGHVLGIDHTDTTFPATPNVGNYLMASGGVRNVPQALGDVYPDGNGWDRLLPEEIAIARASKFAQPVPEPASMAALGLGALAMLRRRRKA